ncbi:hypothetical protein N0V83_001297 [Neocucurbitaria cava]|uniref:Methyltransferase n=1 Tax=Neocucurbitaria cava TaxID=798079 RepID=A0A9W8YFX7_9PLEO|nr:hypothetical protein N0V83_001297 [Neocucurbitaria cava]
MSSTSLTTPPNTFPAVPYTPTYSQWPYKPTDFQRADPSDDRIFYRQARLVTHIDNPAIRRLTAYYDTVLPRNGRIMDMCTSWKSFYPASVEQAIHKRELEVYGVGLNAAEMRQNAAFVDERYWRVLDLNKEPYDVRAGWEDGGQKLRFDAVTCFPDKVVRRWMMLSEQARLEFVGDYLQFAGWNNVEIVDLCARDEEGRRVTDDQGTVVLDSPRLPSHLDPLWVVRATKSTSK